ncbi:MAG: branched-chain amino acid ABC transporter permease [Erysipelotrichaceae bacterium]|nr:branched-chain amino acid ABC transporter permease [Erysipelotrichaceae bacterium]
MPFDVLVQQICNGLVLGCIYALVSIGYTITYGIIRLINFAHNSIFMLSMYFALVTMTMLKIPWYFAFVIIIGLTALMGVATEKLAYHRLRNRGAPTSTIKIAALGVSYLIDNVITVVFSGRPKQFPDVPLMTAVFEIGPVRLQRTAIIVPVVVAILLFGLMFILNKTKPGLAMRAVSRDMEAARLMGIDVDKTIAYSFAIGSGLAAVGAIFWGLRYPSITPSVGSMPGMKSFIAAVIGGIGNIDGAVIGGMLIGMIEVMVIAFFPKLSSYRDVFSFCLLLIVLLVKPTGIIGEKVADKA